MKIAVVGAGAMGSLYGGWLSKKNDVYLIDIWEDHVNTINEEGLVIEELDGEKTEFYPKAVTDSSNLPIMDLVIVFVKSIMTKESLEDHKNIIGKDTILLSLQNGYGNDQDMAEFADEDHIVVGTTNHGCTIKGPGYVLHAGSGDTVVGSFSGDQKNAEIVKKHLEEVGFKTVVNEQNQELILTKLFVNIGINPTTALLDVVNGEVYENKYVRGVAVGLVEEAVEIANLEGFSFNKEDVVQHVLEVAKNTKENCSSMRADILKMRRTEIDKINGAIVKMAEKHGVEAPLNRQIVGLIKAKELI